VAIQSSCGAALDKPSGQPFAPELGIQPAVPLVHCLALPLFIARYLGVMHEEADRSLKMLNIA
jgi:hypothetical protein